MDLTTLFSLPEEKLWLVVQDYQGGLEKESYNQVSANESKGGLKRGFRLEKNSVIKFGRVRLRVRDVDYAESYKINKNLAKHQQSAEKANVGFS